MLEGKSTFLLLLRPPLHFLLLLQGDRLKLHEELGAKRKKERKTGRLIEDSKIEGERERKKGKDGERQKREKAT